MKNKILVHLLVPEIDESYDVFIPINIRIGTVVKLLNKSILELTNGIFQEKKSRKLYSVADSTTYLTNALVRETNILNGVTVILM